MQAARVRAAVGAHRGRALRRHRRAAAPVPVRRAGQLPRAHRSAAGEQRAAHRARGARCDAVEGRARAGGAAADVERGARAPAPMGPAVVVADPAGARLRDRSPRVRRPLRGVTRGGGQDRRARGGRRRRAGLGARRWRRVRHDRRDEAPLGAEPRGTGTAHRKW